MVKVYLISLVFILIFLHYSYAESIIININPTDAFFGDNIEINVICPENYFLDRLILNRSDRTLILNRGDRTQRIQIFLSQKEYVLPDFSIMAICSDGTYFLRNFSHIRLNVLNFTIEKIINNYTNEEIVIQVFLTLRIDGSFVSLNPWDFDLFFSYTNDFDLEVEGKGNYLFIRFFSNKAIDSIEKITIYLRNFSRNFTQNFRLIISNPLKANVVFDENKIYYPEESVIIPIEILYKDVRLFSNNISISIENTRINRIFDCLDRVCVNLSLPRESSIIRFRISYGVHFIDIIKRVNIGKIGFADFYDYENKPMNVILRIDNLQYTISGNQTFLYVPGVRNITLKYRNVEVNLINVNLTEFEESIKIYPIEIIEKNLKILDFFVFETNLKAEKIFARVYYDERKIDSEEKILVVICEKFSLKDKICKNWKSKNFLQNTLSNFLEFEISLKEFFGMAEKLDLKVQYTLNKQKFYLGDKIILKGIIVDNLGRLQDISLKINFLNRNYTFQTQNGRFEIILDTPNIEGRYNLSLFSDSDFFNNFRENITILVEPKIELALITQSIKLQNFYDKFFVEIKNTGQKDLENLFLIVENCKTNREKIEKILVNEVERIEIFDCSNSTNPQILKLNLKNQDAEFNFEIPIYFEIGINQSKTTLPTGRFVFVLDNNTYLSILISVFIVFFSVILSKRKSEIQKIRGKSFLKKKFR